jgi:hypothetical protein
MCKVMEDKFSLCLNKHQDVKKYRDVMVQLHTFWTLAPYEVE